MLTIDLNISSISDSNLLDLYISDYTEVFYKFYKHPERMCDDEYHEYVLNNYHLDRSILDCLISDVSTSLKQDETSIKKKQARIIEINELLKDDYPAKKDKRNKFKLIRKLAELKRNISNKRTFGGKALLREITKLSQNKNRTEQQDILLKQKKELFKSKRKLELYLIGRACEKGNRKVHFNLDKNKILLKLSKTNRIEIDFNVKSNEKKKLKILEKLQHLADTKQIPLTIRITNKKLYITYDELIVNDFKFDEINCKKEQKLHIDNDVKKSIYIKYCRELDSRKLVGKIENRYMSVDLNPYYIGISIFDYTNGEIKIIDLQAINLKQLKPKKGLSSSNPKQKYLNNKRKHEIKEAWKYIFNLAKHYKVFNFVYEDLEFKHKEIKQNKELNKQTKNLWHRTLTTQLILKHCNIIGLKLIEVSPVYSSFIGNMIYAYFDPISSSLEIGRRGATKYIKGSSIYPLLSGINQEKLDYLLGENTDISGTNWKQLYGRIRLMRYRNPWDLKLQGSIAENLRCVQSEMIVYKHLCF